MIVMENDVYRIMFGETKKDVMRLVENATSEESRELAKQYLELAKERLNLYSQTMIRTFECEPKIVESQIQGIVKLISRSYIKLNNETMGEVAW